MYVCMSFRHNVKVLSALLTSFHKFLASFIFKKNIYNTFVMSTYHLLFRNFRKDTFKCRNNVSYEHFTYYHKVDKNIGIDIYSTKTFASEEIFLETERIIQSPKIDLVDST